MTLKIHITLILFFLFNFFVGKIEVLFVMYFFVIMHELSHMIIAILLGIDIYEVEFLPFGVSAKYKSSPSYIKELLISLSGPLASLFFAFVYNNEFYFFINICIVIFNLIPIYPFDGGRILKVIFTCIFGRKFAYRVIRGLTNILIILFTIFSLYMAACYKKFFFLAISIYMFKISREEIEKEKIMKLINYLQIDK